MDKIRMLFELNNKLWDIGNEILSFARFPKAIKTQKIRGVNKELVNYKKNDKCYVLGLGPSLKSIDFTKLDGDIIATNKFHKFDMEGKYLPTYLVLSDKSFYGGNTTEDLKASIVKYPDTVMVLNGIYRDWCEREIEDIKPHIKRYYFYMWKGGIKTSKTISLCEILPAANNVVHTAIMLAISCGYKEIVLIGCDFNSFTSTVQNHCFKDENSKRLWDMDFELYAYSLAAHAHVELNEYCEKNSIRIVNATAGSLIDAYRFDEVEMNRIYK